mmetsp:Transcript_17831/g.42791  ORF Transcript_17831/g.42791 Transcript_17831/m.42791 type:complete len:193 (+) Transcript_17831:1566-2144(+)
MCYKVVQRNSRGPTYEDGHESYYNDDFMSVEARCGVCGKARVAFVGEDPEMKRVAGEVARQTINEDKAVWVRRFRFLEEPNRGVERRRDPYQPWHRYVLMENEDPRRMTYQRYYTGEKDGNSEYSYDRRHRNQEGSILCVNTVERIQRAIGYGERISRLTWERGCSGSNKHDKWDNQYHRWWPQDLWPYPGL